MSIGEQIEVMINSLTGNNTPAQLVSILKAYSDNTCDITTETGELKRIKSSGRGITGTKGLLTYPNGDTNNPFILLFEDADTVINSLGLGKFTISSDGDLYVELPNGVTNPFSINTNGDLTVTLTGTNQYMINDDGDLEYDRWDI